MPAGEVEPLMTLLRRYATEAAREEARMFCDELVEMGKCRGGERYRLVGGGGLKPVMPA